MVDIQEIQIRDKMIYVFEHHHYALHPWQILSRRNSDIILISFDHHTDTIKPPFLSSTSDCKEKYERIESIRNNPTDFFSELRNDQHIQVALECGFIRKAIIIPHTAFKNSCGDEVPFSIEEKLWSKIWKDNNLYPKLSECTSLEDCERFFKSNIPDALLHKIDVKSESERFLSIETLSDLELLGLEIIRYINYIPNFSNETYDAKIYMPEVCEEEEDARAFLGNAFLIRQFRELSKMSPQDVSVINNDLVIRSKFILDIDLDYFHYLETLKPRDCSVFKSLIREAEIITIAKETMWVDMLKDDESVTGEIILAELLKLIKSIL